MTFWWTPGVKGLRYVYDGHTGDHSAQLEKTNNPATQLTCLKSTVETKEKDVKYI